ncbi:MAG TPA: MaoC/PaaZ C-terminal domain-containing protein [Candidatus Paceibacterota bacterium]
MLKSQIGEMRKFRSKEFGPCGPRECVTQDMFNAFGGVTGDDQWIHTNTERARDSLFKGTVAQGHLLLSLTAEKLRPPRLFIIEDIQSEVVYSELIRYKRAVPAGAHIQGRQRLISVRRVRHVGLVLKFAIQVIFVDTGKVVMEGIVELLYR